MCTHAIEDVLCTGTTGVVETQPYTKRRDVDNRGKQVQKLSEENVPNIVEVTPVGPIKDEEVTVENLHSVEKSYSKLWPGLEMWLGSSTIGGYNLRTLFMSCFVCSILNHISDPLRPYLQVR